jgi:hypothetical protein
MSLCIGAVYAARPRASPLAGKSLSAKREDGSRRPPCHNVSCRYAVIATIAAMPRTPHGVLVLSCWLASSAGGGVVVSAGGVVVSAGAVSLGMGAGSDAGVPMSVPVSAVLAQAASSNAASAVAANAPERSDGFMAMSSVRLGHARGRGHGHVVRRIY